MTGGADAPEGCDKGYFVQPTVFSDVDNSMTIAQEEIFGPVLSIIPYDDEDEAVAIANDTPYGLAGGVWSEDQERGPRFRPPPAHRPGRHQRRQLQYLRPLRWLQTKRQQPRVRQVGARGVPGGQIPPAVRGRPAPAAAGFSCPSRLELSKFDLPPRFGAKDRR